MEKKIYSCDKCLKSVEDIEALRSIKIRFGPAGDPSPKVYNQCKKMDLCVDCLKKLKIIEEILVDDTPIEKVKNIEERLFDIVEELVSDAMGN